MTPRSCYESWTEIFGSHRVGSPLLFTFIAFGERNSRQICRAFFIISSFYEAYWETNTVQNSGNMFHLYSHYYLPHPSTSVSIKPWAFNKLHLCPFSVLVPEKLTRDRLIYFGQNTMQSVVPYMAFPALSRVISERRARVRLWALLGMHH